MKGIDTSEKVSDAKKQLIDAQKQLYETVMQINMVKQILVRQSKAIMSLIRLQGYGITDNEIINVEEFLIRARSQNLVCNNK